MSIAISEEHRELARVACAFLQTHSPRAESRAQLDAPAEHLPSFWKKMAQLGWMGLHVEEELGGQGFGLAELVIMIEELGFAMAPGPYLPTTLAAAVLIDRGSENACSHFVSGLADGSRVGAVGLGGELELSGDSTLEGSAGLVLGAEVADKAVDAGAPAQLRAGPPPDPASGPGSFAQSWDAGS